MIEVISDKCKFKNLEQVWNELFADCKGATFFQTFAYNWIAWNSFCSKNDQLYIMVHRMSSNKVDAILPFYIDNKKRLRFINDTHTDFCDILINDNVENFFNLSREFWDVIDKDSNIKMVSLNNLRNSSFISGTFKVFSINGFLYSNTEHTYFNCPHTDDVFRSLGNFEKKDRNRIKKIINKTEGCHIELFSYPSQGYPSDYVNVLCDNMIQSGKRSNLYFTDDMKRFMAALYNSGLIEIPILFNESHDPLSLEFIFKDIEKKLYMHWLILYKNEKYNLWLNILYTEEKAKQTSFINDFGRGAYQYKIRNFRPDIENLYNLLYSKTIRGNIYILFKIMASHLRKTLKKYMKK